MMLATLLYQTRRRMRRAAPRLALDGHHGYFQKSGPENEAVIGTINRRRPDILYVGMGSPAQEAWIAANMDRLEARVFLPMGAGLDYYSGVRRRGSRWLTGNGAEWLCRLVQEPRRLWKRYLLGNPIFFARIAGCLAARQSAADSWRHPALRKSPQKRRCRLTQ